MNLISPGFSIKVLYVFMCVMATFSHDEARIFVNALIPISSLNLSSASNFIVSSANWSTFPISTKIPQSDVKTSKVCGIFEATIGQAQLIA
ncbi:hypothetical protein D3C84_1038640 [compost metagenome]